MPLAAGEGSCFLLSAFIQPGKQIIHKAEPLFGLILIELFAEGVKTYQQIFLNRQRREKGFHPGRQNQAAGYNFVRGQAADVVFIEENLPAEL